MNRPPPAPDFIHKEYPRQFPRNDFWRQIKRTVNGQPVAEEDISRIVERIERQLELQPEDQVLDLGCGNAALSSRLFHQVSRYLGVDFSTYLLNVAREYFQLDPSVQFVEADMRDVGAFCEEIPQANKILIYGAISYLGRGDTATLIGALRTRLANLERIFIGNVADAACAEEFFAARKITEYSLDDPQSPIGVWWSASEWAALAEQHGLTATCTRMPDEFYASKYRFDVLLENQD